MTIVTEHGRWTRRICGLYVSLHVGWILWLFRAYLRIPVRAHNFRAPRTTTTRRRPRWLLLDDCFIFCCWVWWVSEFSLSLSFVDITKLSHFAIMWNEHNRCSLLDWINTKNGNVFLFLSNIKVRVCEGSCAWGFVCFEWCSCREIIKCSSSLSSPLCCSQCARKRIICAQTTHKLIHILLSGIQIDKSRFGFIYSLWNGVECFDVY